LKRTKAKTRKRVIQKKGRRKKVDPELDHQQREAKTKGHEREIRRRIHRTEGILTIKKRKKKKKKSKEHKKRKGGARRKEVRRGSIEGLYVQRKEGGKQKNAAGNRARSSLHSEKTEKSKQVKAERTDAW